MSRTDGEQRVGRTAEALAMLFTCGLAVLCGARSARADYLVVAPHPDDDVITSAGVIYRARQSGTVVWVAYMTNGDYAPGGTAWGLQRQVEAVAAQALFGVTEDHLVFLGYPDGSLQSLYASFFNVPYVPTVNGYLPDMAILMALSNTTYASHGLGGMDYHRYAFGSSGANTGSNVQADLVHFLTNRVPTDIYVTGRCDRHPDHTTTYEFLMSALAVVRASSASYNPIIHQTIVWAGFNTPPDDDDWPLPPNPATDFTEPVRVSSCLSANSLVWAQRESLAVPSVMQLTDYNANLKSLAIDEHDTQGGFHSFTVRSDTDGHISAFVHRDEFFYPFRVAALSPPRDPGVRPPAPPVDAGTTPVDAGTTPIDSGPPPVDAGTAVDAGSNLDSSTLDSGGSNLDAGPTQLDASAQLADAETAVDAAQGLDAAIDAAATPSFDAMVADAGSDEAEAASPPDLGGGSSAWPGDEDFGRDIDDIVDGDAGEETKAKKGSGCGIAASTSDAPFSGLVLALSLAALLLRRQRASARLG